MLDFEATLAREQNRQMDEIVSMLARWPERRRDIAIAFLGQAIGACDMLGADADAFLAHLRATHPKPAPLVPAKGSTS